MQAREPDSTMPDTEIQGELLETLEVVPREVIDAAALVVRPAPPAQHIRTLLVLRKVKRWSKKHDILSRVNVRKSTDLSAKTSDSELTGKRGTDSILAKLGLKRKAVDTNDISTPVAKKRAVWSSSSSSSASSSSSSSWSSIPTNKKKKIVKSITSKKTTPVTAAKKGKSTASKKSSVTTTNKKIKSGSNKKTTTSKPKNVKSVTNKKTATVLTNKKEKIKNYLPKKSINDATIKKTKSSSLKNSKSTNVKKSKSTDDKKKSNFTNFKKPKSADVKKLKSPALKKSKTSPLVVKSESVVKLKKKTYDKDAKKSPNKPKYDGNKSITSSLLEPKTILTTGKDALKLSDPNAVKYKQLESGYYLCIVCKQLFLREDQVKRHLKTWHFPPVIYECDYCGKLHKTKYRLSEHINTHRDNYNDYLWCCDQCDYRARSKYYLKTHLVRKHTVDAPYECDICQRRFKIKSDIKFHLGTHSNSQHMCDICGRMYTSQDSLVKHRRVNHVNEYNYRCPICKQKLLTQEALDLHVKKHKDSYKCDECGLKFKKKYYVTRHKKRIHREEKTNECHICNKSFTCMSTYRIHYLTHAKVKPYLCNVCGFSFTQRSSMMLHWKRKHPEAGKPPPSVKLTNIFGDIETRVTQLQQNNEVPVTKRNPRPPRGPTKPKITAIVATINTAVVVNAPNDAISSVSTTAPATTSIDETLSAVVADSTTVVVTNVSSSITDSIPSVLCLPVHTATTTATMPYTYASSNANYRPSIYTPNNPNYKPSDCALAQEGNFKTTANYNPTLGNQYKPVDYASTNNVVVTSANYNATASYGQNNDNVTPVSYTPSNTNAPYVQSNNNNNNNNNNANNPTANFNNASNTNSAAFHTFFF